MYPHQTKLNIQFNKIVWKKSEKTKYVVPVQRIDVECVREKLQKLSPSSAGYHGTAYKVSNEVLAKPPVTLMNEILKSGIIPDDWKIALITPLHKRGDQSQCDNNRDILVFSPIVKIFKSCLSDQIFNHFNAHQLFSDAQHGFCHNMSCETAIQSILEHCTTNSKTSKYMAALFIDTKNNRIIYTCERDA